MREIDRKAAKFRLLIDRRVFAHVFAHVGDRDVKRALFYVKIDRVVEVLGVDGIDGAKGQMLQIHALRIQRPVHFAAEARGLLLARFVKFVVFIVDR